MNPKLLTLSANWRIDAAGLSAMLGLTFVAYALIVNPIMESQMMFDAQRSELLARERKVEKATANVNWIRKEILQLQKATEANPISLIGTQQSNRRLADLTSLAAAHSLDVHELALSDASITTPPSASSSVPYEIVGIDVAGAGSFQTCAKFLQALGQTYQDLRVRRLAISHNPSDANHSADFRFALNWFAAPSLSSAAR